jgi:hypothetical protein
MLCTPRKDGDGKKLASELRKRLDEELISFAIAVNMSWESYVRITSCRYLSDGEIKVTFLMDDLFPRSRLTEYLYDRADVLDIDIMEAGED